MSEGALQSGRVLGIGLLGASGIAPKAIIDPARRRSDVRVAAVASQRDGAASRFADEHGITGVYSRYEDLVEDDAIDIVYVGLPISAHAEWTIAALESGKHVICEKPFALDAQEARRMVDAARRNDRQLIEGFHYRYHPLFEHVLDICRSGRLGEVRRLRACLHVSVPFHPQSIRHAPHLGGGALMDLGCYPVHWVRSIMESEPQVRSAEVTRTRLGVDESLKAEMVFANGGVAEVSASMAEGITTSCRLSIAGSDGTFAITNPAGPHDGHSITAQFGSAPPLVYTLAGKTTFDYQLAAFLGAIETRQLLPTGGKDAVANMTTIDSIYAAVGGRVAIDYG